MLLAAGTRLGPQEVSAPLGAGGMREVYRARDPRLGRDVAVKVLPASLASDPERLRRFEEEARAIAALSHPNVFAIYDVGTGDPPFLVTAFLEGETLRARIDRGALPWAAVGDIALQFLAGLAAAHARGIVHRDLKPDNIFITRDGVGEDPRFRSGERFGPRERRSVDRYGDSHRPAVLLGTVGCMAPEQNVGGVASASRRSSTSRTGARFGRIGSTAI